MSKIGGHFLAPSAPQVVAALATAKSDAELLHDVRAEFNRFWSEEPLNLDADPLLWWRQAKLNRRYPLIMAAARKYLTPVASSAMVERTFSAAKFWCRNERGRIGMDTLDAVAAVQAMLASSSDEELMALVDLKVNPFAGVVPCSAWIGEEPDDVTASRYDGSNMVVTTSPPEAMAAGSGSPEAGLGFVIPRSLTPVAMSQTDFGMHSPPLFH